MQKESSAKKVRIQHIEKIVCFIQTNYFVSEIYMYVNKWELQVDILANWGLILPKKKYLEYIDDKFI